jgi:hypothetical protein
LFIVDERRKIMSNLIATLATQRPYYLQCAKFNSDQKAENHRIDTLIKAAKARGLTSEEESACQEGYAGIGWKQVNESHRLEILNPYPPNSLLSHLWDKGATHAHWESRLFL